MHHFLVTLLIASTSVAAMAERIIPPSNLFRDKQFIRGFVGSYGFHSEVEPKVTSAEQQLLVRVRELFGEGKFTEAEQEIVRFIKTVEAPVDPATPPGDVSAAMVFVLGNLYFSADRADEARRAFLEAIRRFPKFRRAHVNLAYLYVSREEYAKALAHFQEAATLGEGSSRVYGLMGYCYLLQKKAVASENAYRQAYLLDPGNKDWKLGLAQALLTQEKLPEASSLLGTLIEEYPEDPQLWLQQTNAFLGQERKMEAAVNLEVLRLKGLAGESELNLLGNLYMDQEEPQLALIAYLDAIDKAPALNLERALKSARVLNDYGFPDKAEVFVGRIRSKLAGSLSPEQHTELSLVEVRIARADEDVERVGGILKELTVSDPANGEVLLELGRHFDGLAKEEESESKRKKWLAEAMTNLQLALGVGDVAYEANLELGQLYVRERRYLKALPLIEKALELKGSENLKLYVSRVRRAADREQQRLDREDAERSEREITKKLGGPHSKS